MVESYYIHIIYRQIKRMRPMNNISIDSFQHPDDYHVYLPIQNSDIQNEQDNSDNSSFLNDDCIII